MSGAPISVALVYDLDYWILGTIAREMAAQFRNRPGAVDCQVYARPAGCRELGRILERHDVIHFLSNWDCFAFAGVCDKPVVTSVYHMDEREQGLLAQHMPHIDAVCYFNREVLAQLCGLLGPNPVPIYKVAPGLDLNAFRPNPEARGYLLAKYKLPGDSILLGLSAKRSSNAFERKGFDRYWKLLERLAPKWGNRLKLVVFGPAAGEPGGWSESDIPAHLRGHVVISGFVPAAEYPLSIAGLDDYVCLSRLEGIPYPVLESMACGVTTISTSVGVVPDVIRDGVNGFIVDENNYLDRIAEILDRRASEDFSAISAEARRALERYGWPAAADPDWHRFIYEGALRHRQAQSRYLQWRKRYMRNKLALREMLSIKKRS